MLRRVCSFILISTLLFGAGISAAQAQFSLGLASPIATHRSLFRATTGTFERLDQFAYRPPADGCQPQHSELWSNFDIAVARQEATDKNVAYDDISSLGLYSFDTHRGRNSLWGINLGGTLGETKTKSGGLRERDTLVNFMTSVYGIRYSAGWSLKGVVGYSYNSYKLYLSGQPDRSHSGNSLHGAVELARRFRFGQTILSPYYSFNALTLVESEQNYFGIGKRTTDRYLQGVGLRWGRDFFLDRGWIIYPHLDLAWRHNYDVKTWIIPMPGSDARITPMRDLAVLTGGINFIFNSQMWAYTRYEVEFAEKYSFHILTGGFVWTF